MAKVNTKASGCFTTRHFVEARCIIPSDLTSTKAFGYTPPYLIETVLAGDEENMIETNQEKLTEKRREQLRKFLICQSIVLKTEGDNFGTG